MLAWLTVNWPWVGSLVYVVVNEVIAGSPLKSNSTVQLMWSWIGYLLPKGIAAPAPAPVAPPPVAPPPVA